MTATCAFCDAPLAPDARYCAQCGNPVAVGAVAAWSAGPYERPTASAPAVAEAEWHAADEEFYPEDFPEHLSADTGRGERLGSPWQEPDGERGRALLIGGGLLVGLLVLIALVYFLLFRPASSPTAALPSTSVSASAPNPTSPPPAVSASPPAVTTPPSPSGPAYPAVALPAGSTLCPAAATGAYAHVAAGNSSTSCEFATAVRAAYVPVAAPGGSVAVRATSPRTGKSYTMTCSGNQPVFCTGGNNAQVIIFGGTAR